MTRNCLKCGRFMRRVPKVQIWVCMCGQWIAELSDFRTMQVVANELITRSEEGAMQ